MPADERAARESLPVEVRDVLHVEGPLAHLRPHETGDAGAHRVIYMDGRKHPDDLLPTWWGHSIGRWEGDTLVVDTVGYNDKFWFDSRGTPHTEQLHTIERYTRVSWGRLRHEFWMEDPGALSRPVTLNFTARLLRPDRETGVVTRRIATAAARTTHVLIAPVSLIVPFRS